MLQIRQSYWELLVGGTGQGCPIAARNLLQAGTGKSRKGVRLAPPHPGDALGEDGVMKVPVQIVLSGIVGAGFWGDQRDV